jgi:hypothetical protein
MASRFGGSATIPLARSAKSESPSGRHIYSQCHRKQSEPQRGGTYHAGCRPAGAQFGLLPCVSINISPRWASFFIFHSRRRRGSERDSSETTRNTANKCAKRTPCGDAGDVADSPTRVPRAPEVRVRARSGSPKSFSQKKNIFFYLLCHNVRYVPPR